ncbi:MAG: crotonase/enoyl-CoA hydratase family protein [Proteobacteria bacterium]|nr:crotonase/enoyl-CoA hydratase family protein [Pseudomonadota bacterium]
MQQPSCKTLKIEIENKIATIWLNRPDKGNSMNEAMWSELELCFRWLDQEPGVRVVILAALGKHFCTGLDLAMFSDLVDQSVKDPSRRAEQLRHKLLALQVNLTAIEKCRKPVIAAIHHTCIGGGIDMITCCDMRYCSSTATFSIKEIDLAMTADVGSLQRLPSIIGQGMLRELAYTGRTVDADEAKSLGLVNKVFATPEELYLGVREIAAIIATKSPLAIRGSKEMLLYARDHSVEDGLNYIATWNAGMMCSDDIQKAITASMNGEVAEFDD